MKKKNIIKLLIFTLFLSCTPNEDLEVVESNEKINNCIELADEIEEVFDEIQIEAYESEIYRSYSGIDATKLDYVYEALRINKIGLSGIDNIRDKYVINRVFFENLLEGFYNNFLDSKEANLALEEHLL